MMLSLPNIVMNHGRPAAGNARSGIVRGANRKAARSTRLRRYVRMSDSESHSNRGALSIHFSRPRAIRLGFPFDPAFGATIELGNSAATRSFVDHSWWGSTFALK